MCMDLDLFVYTGHEAEACISCGLKTQGCSRDIHDAQQADPQRVKTCEDDIAWQPSDKIRQGYTSHHARFTHCIGSLPAQVTRHAKSVQRPHVVNQVCQKDILYDSKSKLEEPFVPFIPIR